jgi:hypothetical protein
MFAFLGIQCHYFLVDFQSGLLRQTTENGAVQQARNFHPMR